MRRSTDAEESTVHSRQHIPSADILVGSTTMKRLTLTMFDDAVRKGMQDRLVRIEGQIRGVAKMLDDQRPCLEVLQQLSSVQAALRGVSKSVMRNYLERCATQAIRSDDPKVYDELMEAIFKFAR